MTQLETLVPIQLAFDRRNANETYVPGSMSDGRKLGIAGDTGGGAGINSLGPLRELARLGYLGVADVLLGNSVGGVNDLIAASNNFEAGIGGYERMTQSGFVDKRRLHRVMNMGILRNYMTDDVTGIDVTAVKNSSIPIIIALTRLTGGIAPVTVNITQLDSADMIDPVLWGASIPGAVGLPPRDKKGILGDKNAAYCDGGYSKSVIDMAVEAGCTDLIYLPNQPFSSGGNRRTRRTDCEIALVGALMTPYDSRAIVKLRDTVDRHNAAKDSYRDGAFTYGGMQVAGFYPPSDPESVALLPKLFNTETHKVRAALEITSQHIMQRLSAISVDWVTPPATSLA